MTKRLTIAVLMIAVSFGAYGRADPPELARARSAAAQPPLAAADLAILPLASHPVIVPYSSLAPASFDRNRYLAELVRITTRGAVGAEATAVAWTTWLQRHIAHPKWAPMHDAATMITDPVWIIENRIAQCGQTNNVLVQGLRAVGIKARLVQLSGHMAAEAYWAGAWHYLDADWLHDGDMVRREDGTIPSTEDIAANLHWIDRLNPAREFLTYPVDISNTPDLFGRPVVLYKKQFDGSPVHGVPTPTYH